MTSKIQKAIRLLVAGGVRIAAPSLLVTAIFGIGLLALTVDLRGSLVEANPLSRQVQGLVLSTLRSF
jgi:hypothetical protein